MTLIFTDLLPDFAVITTVPFFFAIIFPELLTVAIFLFADVYVIPSEEFFGALVTFQLYDLPFFNVIEVLLAVSFVVFTFSTLTFTVAFLLPDLTVIVALPGFTAVILPDLETVTTFLLEEE